MFDMYPKARQRGRQKSICPNVDKAFVLSVVQRMPSFQNRKKKIESVGWDGMCPRLIVFYFLFFQADVAGTFIRQLPLP